MSVAYFISSMIDHFVTTEKYIPSIIENHCKLDLYALTSISTTGGRIEMVFLKFTHGESV